MIYTSNKPQAKRITTRTWWSSTDITNIQKELLRVQVSLLSHYLQLLKIISTRTPASSLESLFFFYYKKQQATSRQPAARCLFIFFYSKKQQATSQQRAHLLTLDMLTIRLYKISN